VKRESLGKHSLRPRNRTRFALRTRFRVPEEACDVHVIYAFRTRRGVSFPDSKNYA
jgi:hypothetical protein